MATGTWYQGPVSQCRALPPKGRGSCQGDRKPPHFSLQHKRPRIFSSKERPRAAVLEAEIRLVCTQGTKTRGSESRRSLDKESLFVTEQVPELSCGLQKVKGLFLSLLLHFSGESCRWTHSTCVPTSPSMPCL